MLAPDNDASTGSLETPDAPRSLCTKSKKLCTTKPNWFYALMVSCMKQSFSMQRPTNCQGSVPFPTYALCPSDTLRERARYANALFTLQASSFVSSGQWLADIIIVAQIDYDYGKRQSISSSANPARMGQARKNSESSRNLFSRSASRLYQTTTDLRDWRLFRYLLLDRPTVNLSWRYPHRRPPEQSRHCSRSVAAGITEYRYSAGLTARKLTFDSVPST